MFLHLVAFKYRPDVEESAREDHRAQLRGLSAIDGVLDLKVGADVVRASRSFDTGLLVTFRDRAALDAYQVHDRHVPVAALGVALCVQIVAVDFENEDETATSATDPARRPDGTRIKG
jgi:hypothetical protein